MRHLVSNTNDCTERAEESFVSGAKHHGYRLKRHHNLADRFKGRPAAHLCLLCEPAWLRPHLSIHPTPHPSHPAVAAHPAHPTTVAAHPAHPAVAAHPSAVATATHETAAVTQATISAAAVPATAVPAAAVAPSTAVAPGATAIPAVAVCTTSGTVCGIIQRKRRGEEGREEGLRCA